jgi:hypothetical protein
MDKTFFRFWHKARTSVFFWGVLFTILYSCFSFVNKLKSPDDIYLPPDSLNANLFWLIVYLSSFVSYVLFLYFLLKYRDLKKNDLKWGIAFTALFSVIFIGVNAIGSADLYAYYFFAEVYNSYQQNPYNFYFNEFPDDLIFTKTQDFWHNFKSWQKTGYGPLFTLISILLNLLAGQDMAITIYLHKLLTAFCVMGGAVVLYKIVEITHPQKAVLLTFAFMWNPFLLFEAVNNGHNDTIVLFLNLLAIYLLIREKYLWVLPIVASSVLIKYVTVLFIPFFVLYIFRQEKTLLFWIKTSLICAAITIVSSLLFLSKTANIIDSLFVQIGFTAPYWFYLGTMPLAAKLMEIYFGFDLLILKNILGFCFLLFWLYLVFIKRTDQYYLSKILFVLITAFFMIALFWVQPWYFLWVFPLPLIFARDHWFILMILTTMTGILCYFIPVGFLLMISLIIYTYINRNHETLSV